MDTNLAVSSSTSKLASSCSLCLQAPSRQWQGERPEFSCLQTLVLTSAPRLAVWTVALIYLPWLVRRRTARIETKNWLYWAKQVTLYTIHTR